MNRYFPPATDQTPWRVALLSLLPFCIGGLFRIIVSYQPGWMPAQGSPLYLLYLLASSLVVAAGLAAGAARQFPRWVYPCIIYLAFALYLLTGYAASLLPWPINVQGSFFLYLAIILLILWLPGLRAFYTRIRQDWTLLSYGLYGLVLYLLASLDFDTYPNLSLLAVLPSALSLSTALVYLRIRSAGLRMAVLLAGTYSGLFVWLLPVFQGAIYPWLGYAMGLFMLLLYGVGLTVVLLSPLLGLLVLRAMRAPQVSP